MAIEEWADLFPDLVTIEPYVKRDRTGAPGYGAARQVRARVTPLAKQVRTPAGVEATSTSVAWVADATLGTQDRITLPNGATPEILSIERPEDENGPHHTKVYFG